MSKSKSNIKNNVNSNTSLFNKENIIYIIFLALIILPLYFKGAYFENIYLPFIIGMGLITLFHIRTQYKGTRTSLIQNDSDILLILFVLLYSLTFFYGVNKRGSLIEFAKNASYMAVFLMSRDMGKDEKKRLITIDFIILAGIVVTIIGMGSMIGTWEYSDAYMTGRLASTFQYPNTLATYASALYFLTMGRAMLEENRVKLFLYGGSLTVFFSAVIFTASRGMWLLFPLILLAYFIIIKKKDKVTLFFYSLFNLIVAVPFSFIFLKYLGISQGMLWGLYIVGILISGILFYLLGLGNKFIKKISLKAVVLIIVILSVVAGGLGFYVINKTVPLEFENSINTPVTSSIVRNINNVFPGTEYILNVQGKAEKPEDKQYAGLVVLYSTNEKGESSHLATYEIAEDGQYDLQYKFDTLTDTKSLIIYFQNVIENTSITFDRAELIDKSTDEIINVPLDYKYIPEDILARIMSINITTDSSQARIIFSKDALSLVKANPILGSGGDGWATTYKSVQTYPYWSKHVHNYFLQMMVEIGILGFLVFIGFLVSIIYAYIMYKKRYSDINNSMADTLIIAILAILGHAMIDFDLSLVSVAITLWALIGILTSIIYSGEKEKGILISRLDENAKKITFVPILLISLALFISISAYMGTVFVDRSIAAQDKDDIDGLQKNMERANTLDPYNTKYKLELINIYFYQNTNNPDPGINYGNMAKSVADRLIKIGKNDPVVVSNVAQSYLTMGLIEEGIELTDKVIDLQPITIEAYIQKAKIYLSVFNHYMSQGQLDKAQDIALKGSALEGELKQAYETSIRPIVDDNELNLNIFKLKYLGKNFDDYISHLEQNEKLVYYYDFGIDMNNDGEVDMLNTSIPEGSKIAHEYIVEDGNSFIRIKNEGEVYGFKYVYPLSLQPDTDYILEFYTRGDIRPETFDLYIWSDGAVEPNQGNIISVPVSSEWMRNRLEFTTSSDVEPGGEYIRIQHNGNDAGYFDIRDITVFYR